MLCEKKVKLQLWDEPVYNVYKIFCNLSKTYSAMHVPEAVQPPSVRSLTNLCLLKIANYELKPRFYPWSDTATSYGHGHVYPRPPLCRLTRKVEHGPCIEISQNRKLEKYIPERLHKLYGTVCRILNAAHIVYYLARDMFRNEMDNNNLRDAVWRTKFHLHNICPIDTIILFLASNPYMLLTNINICYARFCFFDSICCHNCIQDCDRLNSDWQGKCGRSEGGIAANALQIFVWTKQYSLSTRSNSCLITTRNNNSS